MKFLLLAITLGLVSGYVQADEAETLKADIEAAKQRLSAAEVESQSLRLNFADQQAKSDTLQTKLDQQARLLELIKASMNQAETAAVNTAPAAEVSVGLETTEVAVLDEEIISAPVAETPEAQDGELEFEIELTE